MKKRLFSFMLVTLLSLSTMLGLSACAKDGFFIQQKKVDILAPNKIEALTDLDGFVASTFGNIALFSSTDTTGEKDIVKTKVYNGASQSFIIESVDTYNAVTKTYVTNQFTLHRDLEFTTIIEQKIDTEINGITQSIEVVLYNENAVEFARKTIEQEDYADEYDFYINSDLVRFDKKLYRVNKDGSIVLVFNDNDFAPFPIENDNLIKAGDYYSIEKISQQESSVDFYSTKDGKYVRTYYFDRTAIGKTSTILNDGKLLVQYIFEADNADRDYDYIVGADKKYNVETIIYNPKNGKEKEIDFDYIITDMFIKDEVFNLESYNFDNAGILIAIEDERIQSTLDLYYISNNGKVEKCKTYGDNVVDIIKLANNYKLVERQNGKTFLYNAKDKLVGEISISNNIIGSYFVVNDKLYDYDFNVVLDMKANEYAYEMSVGEKVVILSKETEKGENPYEYYYFDGTTATSIGFVRPSVLAGGVFYITTTNGDNGKIAFYNVNNAKIGEVSTENGLHTVAPVCYDLASGSQIISVGNLFYKLSVEIQK